MTREEFRAQSAAWYKRPSIFAQTDRGATKPRYARPGDRYGELTIAEEQGRTPKGDIIWKCRCDCGQFAYRTTMILNRSIRNGCVPSCAKCLIELNRGREIEYHDRRHDQMLDLWFERGTLWSDVEVENLKARILEDLEEEIAPVREEEIDPDEMTVVYWPIKAGDLAYAEREMERNHERAKWDRELAERAAQYEREQMEQAQRAYEQAMRIARRTDEVRALELLAYTMAKERGITRQVVKQNLDRWIFEGFRVPMGMDIEARAERAQLIIDSLLEMDRTRVDSNA